MFLVSLIAQLPIFSQALTGTTVLYGEISTRAAGAKKLDDAKTLPRAAAADRAGFAGKSGKSASYDLIDAIKDKKVDLKKLKDDELPEELKKLKTLKEREEYLKKLDAKRTTLNKEAIDLDKKRAAFIAEEMKKKGNGKDSFDSNVIEMLRKQAKKFEIVY